MKIIIHIDPLEDDLKQTSRLIKAISELEIIKDLDLKIDGMEKP